MTSLGEGVAEAALMTSPAPIAINWKIQANQNLIFIKLYRFSRIHIAVIIHSQLAAYTRGRNRTCPFYDIDKLISLSDVITDNAALACLHMDNL